MLDPPFLTVHDLRLTASEAAVWGGLPNTPEAYPCIDEMTAQDSALTHMVLLCMERRAYAAAREYAGLITDSRLRRMRLGMIAINEEAGMKKEDVVSIQELTVANSLEVDALVRILVRKGIVTEAEILEELRELRTHMIGAKGRGSA